MFLNYVCNENVIYYYRVCVCVCVCVVGGGEDGRTSLGIVNLRRIGDFTRLYRLNE